MRRPKLVARAARIDKAQTTGIGIKDERHRVAVDPVRDRMWFRIQHFRCYARLASFLGGSTFEPARASNSRIRQKQSACQ
jgi:hypothetical protein